MPRGIYIIVGSWVTNLHTESSVCGAQHSIAWQLAEWHAMLALQTNDQPLAQILNMLNP